MDSVILVINAGSSSIKFSVFAPAAQGALQTGPHGQVEGIGTAPRLTVPGHADRRLDPAQAADHDAAMRVIHDWLVEHHAGERSVGAIGHRVVHGGTRFTAPVRIDADVMAELQRLVPLAPLHQPHALAAIRAAAAAAPGVAQYACFDTSFHRTQPRLAQLFALPRAITDAGVLRYGFHGISYEYIARRLRDVAPRIAGGRVVVAHLGNGASLCALHGGRSVATTMGFTALDGLMMGTRCGNLDPGVVLYLIRERGMTPDAVESMLYHDSGLRGVSGISSDMRALLASDDAAAKEAVALFVHRILRELGALAAVLGGLDALVFTAGIGEHAAAVRASVLQQARWLGLDLDAAANAGGGPCISPPGAAASAWVIPTDENLMIARHVRALHDGMKESAQ
jgi:acetate kinase